MDDICINIDGVSHPILCGTCEEPVSFIGEADTKSGEVGCVGCGNIDSVQEVARLATGYAEDEAQLILNRMSQDAARKSKFMTFKGQTSHNEAHSFIVDLKL